MKGFILGGSGDQHVIEICIAVGKAMQDLINEPLKCLGYIPQSEGHAREFEYVTTAILGMSEGATVM